MRFSLCAVFILVLAAAAFPAGVHAAPGCYDRAQVPAHELAFLPSDALTEVTALTPDGRGCVQVPILNGEPVIRQKLYVPFRQLYEAYARAVDMGNAGAARRIYTYIRPTPRPFPLWVWLANEPEGAPMPWGMDMCLKILRVLQAHPSMERDLLTRGDQDLPVLDMQRTWPVLYLLMGGEVWPQEDDAWTASALSHNQLNRLLLWRCPWAVMESMRGKNGETQVRLR